ncbi:MAG: hypothetical protein CL808_08155 [Citromicrobium sp.]|nr:hypothetical protein [Citromicrobium sp.]
MDNLETLALVDVPGSSRDLRAMQALARDVMSADAPASRLAPLERGLQRDLDAAIAGRAAPWTATRTRLEARKLARLAPAPVAPQAPETVERPAGAATGNSPAPYDRAQGNVGETARVILALAALGLWLAWSAQLAAQGSIAWDGGTGPEQTRNLFTLYAPAVLALLATLIAINPPERRVAR